MQRTMARLKVGVLISGRGSNLQALIDAAADPAYPAEIALVISNRPEAPGLERAARAGIAHRVIAEHEPAGLCRGGRCRAAAKRRRPRRAGRVYAHSRQLFCRGLARSARQYPPSLLPAFPGLHAQRQALAAGVRFSGCTVHFVRDAVDTGPIIAQAVVPVLGDDDEASLSGRILAAEHRLYPLAVRLFAEGRLRISGNTVAVAGAEAPEGVMLNPPEALVSRAG